MRSTVLFYITLPGPRRISETAIIRVMEGNSHTGRVALVTGGGRGIGAATAKLLARDGAAVAVTARSEVEISSVAEEISASEGRAIPIRLDVTDEQSVSAAFEKACDELGPVTILVNNAGIPGIPLPAAASEPDAWRKVYEVNVTGSFLCARAAMPHMAAENWGRIINVSSAAARYPMAGMAAYSSSKAALDQLTRVLALEGERYNIAAIGVYPGIIDTQMQEETRSLGAERIGEQLHRMFNNYSDFGMLRQPGEPAELISYLCTPEAKRLNGHIVRLEQLEALKNEP